MASESSTVVLDPTQRVKEEVDEDGKIVAHGKPEAEELVEVIHEPVVKEELKKTNDNEPVSFSVKSDLDEVEKFEEKDIEFPVTLTEEEMKTEAVETPNTGELPVLVVPSTEPEKIEEEEKPEVDEESVSIVALSEPVPIVSPETESPVIYEEVKETEDGGECLKNNELPVQGKDEMYEQKKDDTPVIEEVQKPELVEEQVPIVDSSESLITTEEVKQSGEEEPKCEEELVSVVTRESPIMEEEKPKGEDERESVIVESFPTTEDVQKTDDEDKRKAEEEPIYVALSEEVKKPEEEEEEKPKGEVEQVPVIAESPFITEDTRKTDEQEKSKAEEELVSDVAPSESLIITEEVKKTEEEKSKADEEPVFIVADSPFISEDVKKTEEEEILKAEEEPEFSFAPSESLVITKAEPEEELVSPIASSESAVTNEELVKTDEEEKLKVEEEPSSVIAQSPFIVEDVKKINEEESSKAEENPVPVIAQSPLVEAEEKLEVSPTDEGKETPKVEELNTDTSSREFEFKPVAETIKEETLHVVENEGKTDDIPSAESVEVPKDAETEKTEEPIVKKQSNGILGKMKQTLVKAKKAIIGKSPNTKTPPVEIKGEVEA